MKDQLSEITIRAGADILPEITDNGEIYLEGLYDAYSRPLYRYALALTRSSDDAEDAVQVVFIRVAREWKRIVKINNIKAYLFSAVRNASFNILRGKRRREVLYESACAEFQIDHQDVCNKDNLDSRVICEALGKLPVNQREVLILKIYDEMTFKEIADTVEASINTVTSRYRYGTEKLREVLEANNNG